jgi:hypothetical protein
MSGIRRVLIDSTVLEYIFTGLSGWKCALTLASRILSALPNLIKREFSAEYLIYGVLAFVCYGQLFWKGKNKLLSDVVSDSYISVISFVLVLLDRTLHLFTPFWAGNYFAWIIISTSDIWTLRHSFRIQLLGQFAKDWRELDKHQKQVDTLAKHWDYFPTCHYEPMNWDKSDSDFASENHFHEAQKQVVNIFYSLPGDLIDHIFTYLAWKELQYLFNVDYPLIIFRIIKKSKSNEIVSSTRGERMLLSDYLVHSREVKWVPGVVCNATAQRMFRLYHQASMAVECRL